MNPESSAWRDLHTHGAQQLRPGFADRVLRAARAGADLAPSLFSHLVLCLATAACCFAAVAMYASRDVQKENNASLADWQAITSVTSDAGLVE